jgi:hypothetical protein
MKSVIFFASFCYSKLLESACPSEKCWEINPDSKLCELKIGSDCFRVNCTTDTMTVTFIDKLFGTEGNPEDFAEGDPIYRSDFIKLILAC